MAGDAFFLEKFKDLFEIQGETTIDRTGQNLGDYIFDEFIREAKKILWCSEWKSTFSKETDLSSYLDEAKYSFVKKDGKPGSRVIDAIKNNYELPEYGYAFAIRMTESCVEILWERVKIPKP